MKLKVSVGAHKFTFVANAKEVATLMKKNLGAVTKYSTKSSAGRFYLFHIQDGKVYLIGYSDDNYGVVQIAATDVKGAGSVVIPEPEAFEKLIASRGDIEFSFAGGALQYKTVKGRFSGDYNIIPLTDDQIPRINAFLMPRKEKGREKTPPDLLKAIREGIHFTSLADRHMNEILNVYIVCDGKELKISSSDQFHMALFTKKTKMKAKIKMSLPADLFRIVDDFVAEREAKFYIDALGFRVEGKDFLVGFPPIQVDEAMYNLAESYVTNMGKALSSFVCDNSILQAHKNLWALHTPSSNYNLAIGSKGVALRLSTDRGSAEDKFPIENFKGEKLKVTIDPLVFDDLMSHTDKTKMRFSIFPGRGAQKNIPKFYTVASKPVEGASLTLIGCLST